MQTADVINTSQQAELSIKKNYVQLLGFKNRSEPYSYFYDIDPKNFIDIYSLKKRKTGFIFIAQLRALKNMIGMSSGGVHTKNMDELKFLFERGLLFRRFFCTS
jgi:hypothetical protein